jgi:hypothetical protein
MNFDRRTFLRSVGAADVLCGAGTVAVAGTYQLLQRLRLLEVRARFGGRERSARRDAPRCSQDADQFRVETQMNGAADREGFVVIYPDQYNARNGAQCWN